MRQFLSITTFVLFIASSSTGFADSCGSHYYETECGDDPSCTWDRGSGKNPKPKCKQKESFIGCNSHKSEFYCAPNGCLWDSEHRRCIDKSAGSPPTATAP
jgi:hypothetical protein